MLAAHDALGDVKRLEEVARHFRWNFRAEYSGVNVMKRGWAVSDAEQARRKVVTSLLGDMQLRMARYVGRELSRGDRHLAAVASGEIMTVRRNTSERIVEVLPVAVPNAHLQESFLDTLVCEFDHVDE